MNDTHLPDSKVSQTVTTLHQPGFDHDHDHSHDHTKNSSQGRLALAAVITGIFMVVEIIGGLISGSLALLADAGHMMTDFAALSLAWAGFAISRRPATWQYTFGYARFQTLTAFLNGLTLVGVAIWIVFEAYHRIQDPSEVLAGPMLYVAIAGLVVNLLVFWILTRPNKNDAGHHENLNMRGAVLHVLGDLLGSVAAIVAAGMIMATGWMPIDPILSVLVALLILKSAWMLIRESAHVLLQGAPKDLDRRRITKTLEDCIPGLISVENFHIWTLNADRPLVSLQAYIKRGVSIEEVSVQIKAALFEDYGIDHATIDVMYPLKAPILETP
ncbi:cation diffusion facilitator family transporter [Fretibacter rubidus]|uniref:cation diffusion facilitator family transporter n=1 Tax=Fretibacter rubidus TaxID=570162 RepID=UPI00352B1433